MKTWYTLRDATDQLVKIHVTITADEVLSALMDSGLLPANLEVTHFRNSDQGIYLEAEQPASTAEAAPK